MGENIIGRPGSGIRSILQTILFPSFDQEADPSRSLGDDLKIFLDFGWGGFHFGSSEVTRGVSAQPSVVDLPTNSVNATGYIFLMQRQLIDRHPDRNVNSLARVIGICIRVFFSLAGSKLSAHLFDQEINLFALLADLDLSHFLFDGNLDPQLLHCLPDGCLLGRFPFVHAAAREDKVIQPGTVTLDQCYFIFLN